MQFCFAEPDNTSGVIAYWWQSYVNFKTPYVVNNHHIHIFYDDFVHSPSAGANIRKLCIGLGTTPCVPFAIMLVVVVWLKYF